MLIFRIYSNIPFFLVLNYFFEKINFLKFWYSILELFSSNPTLLVRYMKIMANILSLYQWRIYNGFGSNLIEQENMYKYLILFPKHLRQRSCGFINVINIVYLKMNL
jgi:hypothetical protein